MFIDFAAWSKIYPGVDSFKLHHTPLGTTLPDIAEIFLTQQFYSETRTIYGDLLEISYTEPVFEKIIITDPSISDAPFILIVEDDPIEHDKIQYIITEGEWFESVMVVTSEDEISQ